MSSRRIVARCAAIGVVVVIGGWYGVAAVPLTAAPRGRAPQGQTGQPRDLRPGEARPPLRRETELLATLSAGTQPFATYLELARLQEARGAAKDAEATLMQGRTLY